MNIMEHSVTRDSAPGKVVNEVNSFTQKLKPFAKTDTGRILVCLSCILNQKCNLIVNKLVSFIQRIQIYIFTKA